MSAAAADAGRCLSIRDLVEADLPAYKLLRDESLAAHPDAFTSDAASERSRGASSYRSRLGDDAADAAVFTLGAWHGERLVGAISCEHDRRAKIRHVAHLVGMMVGADAQRGGVGRALLAECVARARRAPGIELLTLSVTSTNAAAIGLYAAAGFVRYGSLPHAIRVDGRYHAKDQMVLSL